MQAIETLNCTNPIHHGQTTKGKKHAREEVVEVVEKHGRTFQTKGSNESSVDEPVHRKVQSEIYYLYFKGFLQY